MIQNKVHVIVDEFLDPLGENPTYEFHIGYTQLDKAKEELPKHASIAKKKAGYSTSFIQEVTIFE